MSFRQRAYYPVKAELQLIGLGMYGRPECTSLDHAVILAVTASALPFEKRQDLNGQRVVARSLTCCHLTVAFVTEPTNTAEGSSLTSKWLARSRRYPYVQLRSGPL